MNKVVILALILALASCGPVKKTGVHFVDTKSILAELDKDHFGNAFISAIALNVATESPVEEISLLIDEILTILHNNQADADAKNRTDQAVCDDTLAGFLKQIAEQRETIALLEKAIVDNTEISSEAKTDLDLASKDYDETVASIESGSTERAQEHAKWADEDYQNQIAIATLEEGVKLIQHMIHGVAFSQIKVRYDKVLDKLRSSESKRSTLFKPLITSLTQLATKLNYENVMKILDLLQSIRAGIVDEQESSRIAEEHSQDDWEVLLHHLENQKQSLADKKQRLATLIDSTDSLLKQLDGSLENHRVELDNLEESTASQQNWCNEQSASYEELSIELDREISVLDKLAEHLSEKFGAFIEYVGKRNGEDF